MSIPSPVLPKIEFPKIEMPVASERRTPFPDEVWWNAMVFPAPGTVPPITLPDELATNTPRPFGRGDVPGYVSAYVISFDSVGC